MYSRTIETEFLSWMEREEILIITWSRQVWKTSFMKHIQWTNNFNNEFFNLEDFELLSLFNESPKNLIKLLKEKYSFEDKIFVFIDEIQYLNNPSNFLKYIYDEYKDNIKLIVSWSSAFYLDEKFNDSLAWRKKIFHLTNLSFKEFLIFKNEKKLVEIISDYANLTPITKDKIIDYLNEYLVYGGYPKVVVESNIEMKKQLIWEIVNSYLQKDILESKVDMQDKFYNLYKILSSQTSQLVNVNELASTLWISNTSVNKYLHILRKTFHLYELKLFSNNVRKELTKMSKMYIQDLGVKNYFEKNFNKLSDRLDKWAIFETFVFNELRNIYWIENIKFWRTLDKKEIDFVINTFDKQIAYEVKLSNTKVNFTSFLNSYPQFQTWVINLDNVFNLIYNYSPK